MLRRSKIITAVVGVGVLFMSLLLVSYTARAGEVTIETKQVTAQLSVLMGIGGNVGVLTGEDGILLIDTNQDANSVDQMKAAVAAISDKPIRFVVNTQWHYDHVNGNEALGRDGAVILAHENVYKRMSTEGVIAYFNAKFPPAPTAALPVVTFSKTLTLHLNGEDIELVNLGNGHTDGDAVVFFRKANVVHMGDLYFTGMYPFIDVSSEGSLDGMIGVVTHVLAMIDDSTIVIPGHGPVSNKAELEAYLSMLTGIRDAMRPLVKAGKSLADVQAAKPTQGFDATWGKGFLTPEQFVDIVYAGMVK